MKNLAKKTIAIVAAGIMIVFSGCSNLLGGGDSSQNNEKKYTVSGSINLGSALPSSVASALQSAESSARTATSSFSSASASAVWTVTAKQGEKSVTGSVYQVAGVYKYNLELPLSGEWLLHVKMTIGSSVILEGGASLFAVSGTSQVQDVLVSPVTSSGTGSVNLTITDGTASTLISRVSSKAVQNLHAIDSHGGNSVNTGIKEFTNKKAAIVMNNVPAGRYEATLNFEDAAGNILYSCKEIFTVFAGFTTDTWSGESAYMHNGLFTVTDALINGYGTETEPSTKMVLYERSGGNYKYYLSDSATATIPTSADFSSSSNLFAFDSNGRLYCMEGLNVFSNNTEVNGKKITIDDGFSVQYFTIDRATENFYVYAYRSEDQEHSISAAGRLYKFPTFISTGADYDKIAFEDSSCDLSSARFVVNNGNLYAVKTYSDYSISNANVSSTTGTSLSLTQISPLSDIPSDYTHINDILYQDGYVYILFSQSHLGFDSDEEIYKKIYARGGVVRINTFNNKIDVCGWTSQYADVENKYLYAFQDYQTDSSIYYYTADGKNINIVTTIGELGTGSKLGFGKNKFFTPAISASLSQEAFYSPKKFIAIKPKKLVIADDGVAFYTDANDAIRYKKEKRVVTVDLESFAIENSDDASVGFDNDTTASLLFVACMCQWDFDSNNLYRSDNKLAIENGTVINYKAWDGSTGESEISTPLKFFGIPQ